MKCKMRTSPRKNSPCGHYIRGNEGEAGFCDLPGRFRCEEALKKYLPAFSYSSLTDFISCRYKYYFHSILGVRPYSHTLPDAMKAGALWDRWLAGKPKVEVIEEYRPEDILLAKIQALIRSYKDLEINSNPESSEPSIDTQLKVSFSIENSSIVGYVDRAYGDHIVEIKVSSHPEFYTALEIVEHQTGTYLMANQQWEWVDMEIVRLPNIKTGKRQYADESPDDYEERCYQDIISRPAHYFLGWDRDKRIYGKRFWRSEFDLDRLWKTYVWVLRELRRAINEGSWWKNTLSCFVPTECIYHDICKTGVISEELYYYHKPGGEDNATARKNASNQ